MLFRSWVEPSRWITRLSMSAMQTQAPSCLFTVHQSGRFLRIPQKVLLYTETIRRLHLNTRQDLKLNVAGCKNKKPRGFNKRNDSGRRKRRRSSSSRKKLKMASITYSKACRISRLDDFSFQGDEEHDPLEDDLSAFYADMGDILSDNNHPSSQTDIFSVPKK